MRLLGQQERGVKEAEREQLRTRVRVRVRVEDESLRLGLGLGVGLRMSLLASCRRVPSNWNGGKLQPYPSAGAWAGD